MICPICNLDRDIGRFSHGPNRPSGKICNSCRRKKEKKSVGNFMMRLYEIKRRSKIFNIPFNLTKEHIEEIWTGKCAISGKELDFDSRDPEHCPQLDKIVPEIGYVMGNVCWLSAKYNRLKSNMNSEDARLIMIWLANLEKQRSSK